jgi:hypothetical protein
MFKKILSIMLLLCLAIAPIEALAASVKITFPGKVGMLYEDMTVTVKPKVSGVKLSKLKWETSNASVVRVSGNRVIARNGGKILTTDNGNGGWSVFQVGRAVDDGERPVVTGNEILAENGGILEARHFVTLSKGNKITIRNGGVLQTTVAEPEIAPTEPGDIVMENGVFSTRQNNCNVRLFETSVSATSFPNLTVRGKTAFRLTGVQTDAWHGSQDYVFEETSDPRHFVRLEMMDGAT